MMHMIEPFHIPANGGKDDCRQNSQDQSFDFHIQQCFHFLFIVSPPFWIALPP
jgi:hypothetical protein